MVLDIMHILLPGHICEDKMNYKIDTLIRTKWHRNSEKNLMN